MTEKQRGHRKNARPVRLECGHDRWFLAAFYPEPGEDIWCPKCDRYTRAAATPRCESIEGDWKWTPKAKRGHYLVECIRTLPDGSPCGFAFSTGAGWNDAEQRIERHLKRPPHASGRFTSSLIVERKDYDEPPF